MLKDTHPPSPLPAGRAGAYRRQPPGYRAFIPAPLPPDPPIRIEGHLQALLSRADHALGRLAGSIATLPNPDLFILMYVRKEAVLSSQIAAVLNAIESRSKYPDS
jgi:Fic family protein